MKSRDPREFLLRVLGRLFTRWPFQTPTTRATFAETLGTLSNDDDYGSENITKNTDEVSSFQTYVHVLHKTSHWEVSRRNRAVDVKEMY